MKELKLNYKRTLIIGFAFFSILMVWQAYNFYCPLYLKYLLNDMLETNGLTQYTEFIVGCIMALDNVLALFMLPMFGKLSDKTNTKYGKRMPYIIGGMILTCFVFPLISVFYMLNSLGGVIVTMLLVLIIMNIYRSPAVALMPDVTPKPLRSTANGLINLVGYFGPVLISAVNMLPFCKFALGEKNIVIVLIPVFVVVISVIVAIVVLLSKINEPKILDEMKEELELGEELSVTQEKIEEDKPLSKKDKKNIVVLLISVCLWFMAFNAVETFSSTYCDAYFSEYTETTQVENLDEYDTYYILEGEEYKLVDSMEDASFTYYVKTYNGSGIASLATIILTFSSIFTFAIAGYFAVKFGRKANVIVGLILLVCGFVPLYFFKSQSIAIYFFFFLLGVGWALINVNSYPMCVEMSSNKNIGKITGYYYTASMIAQSLTPILLGAIIAFMQEVTLRHLFLYSAILAILAIAVFSLFKENRERAVEYKKGLNVFDQD